VWPTHPRIATAAQARLMESDSGRVLAGASLPAGDRKAFDGVKGATSLRATRDRICQRRERVTQHLDCGDAWRWFHFPESGNCLFNMDPE